MKKLTNNHMNLMQTLKCAIFHCEGTAEYGWPCCSQQHGWLYKTTKGQIQKYQDMIGNWKDVQGLKDLSIEEILYYAERI